MTSPVAIAFYLLVAVILVVYAIWLAAWFDRRRNTTKLSLGLVQKQAEEDYVNGYKVGWSDAQKKFAEMLKEQQETPEGYRTSPLPVCGKCQDVCGKCVEVVPRKSNPPPGAPEPPPAFLVPPFYPELKSGKGSDLDFRSKSQTEEYHKLLGYIPSSYEKTHQTQDGKKYTR